MDRPGDQVPVGAGHHPPALEKDLHRVEPGRHKEPLVFGPDLLGETLEIDRLLFGPVGDPDAAAQVDELQADPEPVFHLHGQLEQHPGRLYEIAALELVGNDKGVQPEAGGPLGARQRVGLEELRARQAVLRIRRIPDDGVPAAQVAGVVAEGEDLRDATVPLDVGDVADVVHVDDRPELAGLDVLLRRRLVGGEHDLLPRDPRPLRHHQFRQRTAVGAAPFLVKEVEDMGIRARLDGEILLEPLDPGKGGAEIAHVRAEPPLVVDMEGGRVTAGHLFDELPGERHRLSRHEISLPRNVVGADPPGRPGAYIRRLHDDSAKNPGREDPRAFFPPAMRPAGNRRHES